MEAMGDRHTLGVLRHAKAAELPGGPDFERVLLPDGQRDSAAAGSWLASHGFRPDLVICSAARRTQQTWENAAPALGGDPEFIAEERLYEGDAEDVMEIIRQTPATVGTLLYVGHNPAAAKLASMVTGRETKLPDGAATAVIGLDSDWADLAAGRGELLASWSPGADG
jgi:phosphohistidine phosphatase